jgi:general secretion pathway protein L
MSEAPDILILLDTDGSERARLRIDEAGAAPAVDAPPANARVSLAVPGEQVTIHWLPLDPSLTPLQAAAAARLMLAEASAQPLSEMHVAAGAEEDGLRCVAAVPGAAMEAWLAHARLSGVDPGAIIPEPLLLPAPQEGFLRLNGAPRPIYRGRACAFSMEDELAALLVADQRVETVEREAFEASLRPRLQAPLVNLRQGAFAKRRVWRIDTARARRIAALTAALIFLTIVIQIADTMRYTLTADRAEAEARQISISILGPGAGTAGPERMQQRLAALGGGGLGFNAAASLLFGAVRATPNAELGSLGYDETGVLRATVRADSPDTLGQLVQRLDSGPFRAEAAPARLEAGRQVSQLTMTPR